VNAKKNTIRWIAVFLTITFVWQNILWANPEIIERPQKPYNLQAPSAFKSVNIKYNEIILEAALVYLAGVVPVREFDHRLRPTIDDRAFVMDFRSKYIEDENLIVPCSITVDQEQRQYEAVIGVDNKVTLRPKWKKKVEEREDEAESSREAEVTEVMMRKAREVTAGSKDDRPPGTGGRPGPLTFLIFLLAIFNPFTSNLSQIDTRVSAQEITSNAEIDTGQIREYVRQLGEDYRWHMASSELAGMGEAAVGPLMDGIDNENWLVRERAALTLGVIGEDALDATDKLGRLLLTENSDSVKIQLVIALGKIGDESATQYLVQVLDNELLTDLVLNAIAQIGDKRAVDSVIEFWENMGPVLRRNTREDIAFALGSIGDEKGLEVLKDLAGDRDSGVRAEALSSMGKIGSADIEEELIEGLNDNDSDVRTEAALALTEVVSKTALEPLIEALGDEEWLVRRNAAKALGKIGNVKAVDALLERLKTENMSEYNAAAGALAAIAEQAVDVDALWKMSKSADQEVREAARSRLDDLNVPYTKEGAAETLTGEQANSPEIRENPIWVWMWVLNIAIFLLLLGALLYRFKIVREYAAKFWARLSLRRKGESSPEQRQTEITQTSDSGAETAGSDVSTAADSNAMDVSSARARSETPRQREPMDLTDQETLAQILIEAVFSIMLRKKLVLAFDDKLGGMQASKVLAVFDELNDLKKEPKYEKLLENLVIIKDDISKLPQKVSDYLEDDAEVFVFARQHERETLSDIEKSVNSVYINEDELPENAYHPLAEIVTITLSHYLDSSTLERIADILEKLNIESIDPEDGMLIFKLLPDAKEFDRMELIKKYANLKRFLRSA